MELFWTPEAIRDRDDIYDYIEADNPLAVFTGIAATWEVKPDEPPESALCP